MPRLFISPLPVRAFVQKLLEILIKNARMHFWFSSQLISCFRTHFANSEIYTLTLLGS